MHIERILYFCVCTSGWGGFTWTFTGCCNCKVKNKYMWVSAGKRIITPTIMVKTDYVYGFACSQSPQFTAMCDWPTTTAPTTHPINNLSLLLYAIRAVESAFVLSTVLVTSYIIALLFCNAEQRNVVTSSWFSLCHYVRVEELKWLKMDYKTEHASYPGQTRLGMWDGNSNMLHTDASVLQNKYSTVLWWSHVFSSAFSWQSSLGVSLYATRRGGMQLLKYDCSSHVGQELS